MASSQPVYVLAATSRPDKVDPALLRPGRLEQHEFVGPPTNETEWIDILCKMADKWKLSTQAKEEISTSDFATEIFEATPETRYFSPADLKATMDTAHVSAVHAAIEVAESPNDIKEIKIEITQLKAALSSTRPSLSREDAIELQEIYRSFVKDTSTIQLREPRLTADDDFDDFANRLSLSASPVVKTLKTTLR